MKHVSPLSLAFVITCVVGVFFFAGADAAAWSRAQEEKEEKEKPRLKNFDPRLRGQDGRKAEKGGAEEEDVVRVETNLVVADVLVLDKQGRSVAGLKREDFVVREDNAPQKIGTFALGGGAGVPRSIVLVIDHSGSQLPYLKTSVEAAKTLVDRLGPRDRMAVVTDSVELLADFTRDKALLKAKLDSLLQSTLDGRAGRSEHYSALLATLTELFDEEDLRPVVIFQADGEELLALKGAKPRLRGVRERAFSFEDLLTAAEKSRATVYAIIPGLRFIGLSQDEQLRRAQADMQNRMKATGELFGGAGPRPRHLPWSDGHYRRWADMTHRFQLAMAGLAKYTGGWADYLERPEQARDVYARVFAGIESRYFIGYYSTNLARDGKRRKVSIEVRGHPDYVVWGRKTYFAPGPDD
ncbi:MAG TPA: VWA domain-containing protein [Pyrinomonadaceae bacterium]